jgi:hypothetical protein
MQPPGKTNGDWLDTMEQELLYAHDPKIKDFTGGHEDWAKWKSRTQCAFSGSGYERVLEARAMQP